MEIRIDGPAEPAGISVGDALRMLASMERALRACAQDETACLALIGVQKGSVIYKIAMSRVTPIATALFSMATLSGSYSTLPAAARIALRDCLKVVAEHDWTVAVRWQDNDAEPGTVLSRSTPPVPDDAGTMVMETTLYGTIERVGGREPSITFRLDDGQRVSCLVTEAEACKWASHLYQTVRLTGEAVMRLEDQKIDDLRLVSLSPFSPQPIRETLSELSRLIGRDLTAADARELLAESRDDGTEAA